MIPRLALRHLRLDRGASSRNRDLSKWSTGAVTSMYYMFYLLATSFNGDLSKWDTGKVTNMGAIFSEATFFNGDLSKWDTGKVTNMYAMFWSATSFNGDLSKWNTGSLSKWNAMTSMFYGATNFIDPAYCPPVPEGVNPPKLDNGDTCSSPAG